MTLREKLLAGMVNPAHPLALNAARQLDPGTYANSGAGGITLAVHTTQFFALSNFCQVAIAMHSNWPNTIVSRRKRPNGPAISLLSFI